MQPNSAHRTVQSNPFEFDRGERLRKAVLAHFIDVDQIMEARQMKLSSTTRATWLSEAHFISAEVDH
jgi:hypothetical protein